MIICTRQFTIEQCDLATMSLPGRFRGVEAFILDLCLTLE
jgi:hypothetical protein